jgi:uncharacterized protein YcfL
MRPLTLMLLLAASAIAGCNRHQGNQSQDQNIAMDAGIPANQMAGNADIETLPADESSTTPSNQLENGYDNPDVNVGTINSE